MSFKFEILPGINPKEFFPDAKFVITYGFTVGDRHYFRFDDPLNTGYDRALKCLVYYKEVEMNISLEFLKAHLEAVDNLFLKPLSSFTVDDLMNIKLLNKQLITRLTLPKEPDLAFKLASVVFFDQFENPQVYEFKYGEKKIAFWKKNTSMADFFLQKPFLELIPYLQHAGENFQAYLQMTESVTIQQLENLLPLLSEKQKTILLDSKKLSKAI